MSKNNGTSGKLSSILCSNNDSIPFSLFSLFSLFSVFSLFYRQSTLKYLFTKVGEFGPTTFTWITGANGGL